MICSFFCLSGRSSAKKSLFALNICLQDVHVRVLPAKELPFNQNPLHLHQSKYRFPLCIKEKHQNLHLFLCYFFASHVWVKVGRTVEYCRNGRVHLGVVSASPLPRSVDIQAIDGTKHRVALDQLVSVWCAIHLLIYFSLIVFDTHTS